MNKHNEMMFNRFFAWASIVMIVIVFVFMSLLVLIAHLRSISDNPTGPEIARQWCISQGGKVVERGSNDWDCLIKIKL